MKIYTGEGDKGTTKFFSGEVVNKDDLRIEAVGTYDEVISVLGIVKSHSSNERMKSIIGSMQNDLFTVCAEIMEGSRSSRPAPKITSKHVQEIELLTDQLMDKIEMPKTFVVPGGTPESAQLDHARTVARRAERVVARLNLQIPVNEDLQRYCNRISDVLYVMARWANKERVKEQQPIYRYLGEQ